MKSLVAYFSQNGHTERAAKEIAQATGADLYRIEPVKPYTPADINGEPTSRAAKEQADPACRPAIEKDLPDPSQYDAIYLGFPIWAFMPPKVIYTFLDTYGFKGKHVFPFATSYESGIQLAEQALHTSYPDIDWQPGARLEM